MSCITPEAIQLIAARRGCLMEATCRLWLEVADARYHVVRGFVDWSAWDWKRHPFAVAVQMADCTWNSKSFQTGTMVWEVMTANKYEADKDEAVTKRVIDTGLDDLFADALTVLYGLPKEVDDNGIAVLQATPSGENAREVHDPDDTLQGIVLNVPVRY